MKSALRGSHACHEICTSRFTKCCACREICTSSAKSAVPVTKSALRGAPSAAPGTKSALRGSQSAVPVTKPANEPQVQTPEFTAPVTKSERLEDHHHVQSAAPATKSAFRSKAAPIPCACHEKSTLERQSTRFPCQKMSAAPRRQRSRDKRPRAPSAVEMHFEDFERHECTVNSSELAAHARATPRLDTGA